MRRICLSLLPLLVVAAPVAAQETPPDTASIHVVRPGDTLWELAERYLRNPYLWGEIFRANRDVVADPHRIYPSERLRIPGLVVQPDAVTAASRSRGADRTVFFPDEETPVGPRITLLETEGVPAVTPGDFFRAGMLVPQEEVVPVGELAEVISPSVVPLQTQRAIQLYDKVFMRLTGRGEIRVGDRLQLLRAGREIRQFGRIFTPTGLATVAALQGGVATIVVDRMHDDVAVGDLAVPIPAFPVRAGELPRPATGVEGRLLAFQSPHAVHAVEDLAFVDLGRDSGLREGDELEVVIPPTRASWGVRPEIRVARVQVIRAAGRTAAVRVKALDHPALEPGLPVRLVGKMP